MSNWSKILLDYLSNNYEQTKENIENTTELTLDGYYMGVIPLEIKNYLEKFNHIEQLNMSFCKLHSLDNLPNLPNITKVELNDNLLNEKEFIKLKKYPLLSEIFFANNKVKDFELMKEMSTMRDIHLIDLSDNPICSSKDYRKNIFDIFPKLIFLDRLGKHNETYEEYEDNEEEEEEEENEEDKKFLDDEYEEDLNEEEEEEEEEENDENNGGNFINNNDDENNNDDVDEEEEEEIENPNLGKRKKYK